MNKSSYFLLTALLALLISPLNAQQFFFSPEKPAFCSAADGILTLVPIRGVPPFSYSWSTGSTELSLRNLPKGTYTATLTDATGATVTQAFILNTQEFDLRLSASTPAGGCNPNSGALSIEVLGGLPPYTYWWSNGMTDAAIQGLSGGVYSVIAQDANGCTAGGEFEVQTISWGYIPDAILSAQANPDCANPNNGALEANLLFDYFPPYTYTWSNGATGQSNTNLSKGTYSVTITNALGCSSTNSIFLDNKVEISGSVICSGNTTGSASAKLINGTAPVTYTWSNGQSGTSLNGLTNGTYSVTASDAQGCTAVAEASVAQPLLRADDYSPDCYSGNHGNAYVYVIHDKALGYIWDNGETTAWTNNLSPGNHTVAVITALGCTLSGSVHIDQPNQPEFTLSAVTSPADCANNLGGTVDITISGGFTPYQVDIYGADGFWKTGLTHLQNLQAGDYYVSVNSKFLTCSANTVFHVSDAGGFDPQLVTPDFDCNIGLGSAEIIHVTAPNVQYEWSNGSTSQDLLNLTEGCYSVTVTGDGACLEYLSICLPGTKHDTLEVSCAPTVTGKLLHDLGVNGCTGTTAIPYQLIRTMPSGALNFTDENGFYSLILLDGAFDVDAVQYSPADIACPPGGKHSVNPIMGQIIADLDFHFLNNNATDLRIQQKPLRTAQPGYPYSLRLEVCNDGNTAVPGTIDFEYGALLGTLVNRHFAQHPGAIVLNLDNTGSPNHLASFNFPNIAPGACELLQFDFEVATATPVGTEFITDASANPKNGDPTPANNVSTLYNTVAGSFDPNSVLAYPARNGNPKDGGEIRRFEDKTIVYQIFFQNTGNAPADLVVVRDLVDNNLDLSTIRNISASHNMKVVTSEDNKELVFKFENIYLPDSTSDYAGSIGSIQYEIDLKPGLPVGADVKKQVSIFFDFNSPVNTNQNVLEIVGSGNTATSNSANHLELFPNPTDAFVGFYCYAPSTVRVFNTMGELVTSAVFEAGLQQINTSDLPAGIYMIHMETSGRIRTGKLMVSH